MRWIRIRKATIDENLRAAFEQYGVNVMQLNLALGEYIDYNGQILRIKTILEPLTLWLTEQYDRVERKETWSLAMECAITAFVSLELLLPLFGRQQVGHPMRSSLSNEAASHALHFSEVTLLAFGIVLGIGIIGEYSDRWKHLLNVFKVLVIVGVFGEVVADAAIFAFSERLTTISNLELADAQVTAGQAQERAARADKARIELEKQMAWRHLTSKQQTALCQAIPEQFTRELMVVSSPQDPEAWQYANEFATPLRDFGISHGFGAMGHLGTQAWSKVEFGVWIQVGMKSNFDVDFAQRLALAARLKKVLEDDGVEVAGISKQEGDIGPLLRIYVGPRLPPQSENTIASDKKP